MRVCHISYRAGISSRSPKSLIAFHRPTPMIAVRYSYRAVVRGRAFRPRFGGWRHDCCWCGRPPAASMCQNEVVVSDLRQRRPSVDQITRIGMDTSMKHIFQLHGVNAARKAPVLRKSYVAGTWWRSSKNSRRQRSRSKHAGASHQCARLLQSLGHSVKLIAPQLVKPYVKRGKNDAADAEALCWKR